MTGLDKQVLEIPLVAGLSQHIAPEVAPAGALYDLTNVEIDRVGNVARRHGHEFMPNAAFLLGVTGAPSSVLSTPKKIGGRRDELWVITSDSYYLGSGGGGGGAGDMIWTYSPELLAWKPHAKVPRPTMERWASLANAGISPEHASLGYVVSGNKSLIVVVYLVGAASAGSATGIHAVVYDATSRAVLVEDTLIGVGDTQISVQSVGSVAFIIWRDLAAAKLVYSRFDAANADSGFTAAAQLLASATDGSVWGAGTDGTSVFVLYGKFASSQVLLEKFTAAGVSQGSNVMDTFAPPGGTMGVAYAGGRMHCAWSSGVVRYGSISTSSWGSLSPTTPVNVNASSGMGLCIAALDADNAVCFYSQAVTASGGGVVVGSAASKLYWRWISAGSTSPVVAATEHQAINVQPQGDPFAFDGRIFLPAVGIDRENQFRLSSGTKPYSGYGHTLLEFSRDSGSGVSYMTAFPVAVWARDASRANGPGSAGFGDQFVIISSNAPGEDSDRFLATLRLLRNVDRFGAGGLDPSGGTVAEPALDTTAAYGIDIVRIAFDDKKRWAHSEYDSCAVIASALPFAYDGLEAHECGYVFRPEVLGVLENGTGSFVAGNEPTYKCVYEWEDTHGQRWLSDTSYPAQVKIVGTNVATTICCRLPTLSAKPLGGSNFSGRIKISLHRSMATSDGDFQKIGETFVDTFGASNVLFNDDGSDSFQASERAYTVGGELDNCLMPPCRAVAQHGPRLACISTDDGKLWISKESRYQRGIEWSAYLTMSLPQRGMALASTEAALLVLCEKSLYALEGLGPNALGQPPDGWRLTLIAHDKGCSEINAAWRTPVGIIYRGYQGLWAIGGQMGLSFIGEPVTDFTDQVTRFVDGCLDTRRARLRLLCLMDSGDYRVLNYWYDSNRWSVDTIEEEEGTQYSSTVFQGVYHRALQDGVYRAVENQFHDANTLPLYLASVRTGWIRMGAMHEFKRVWRALGTVGKIRAEEANPILDLQFTVENENGVCASRLFDSDLFPPLGDWSVRMHLTKQKGKAFRLQLTEVPNNESDQQIGEFGTFARESPGYTFSSLGFEFGVKRGAAKLPATRTK